MSAWLKAALAAFLSCPVAGCAPARIDGAAPASEQGLSWQLLSCLEAMDFSDRSEVERALGVSLSGGTDSGTHRAWSAQRRLGPSTSVEIRLLEGKPEAGSRNFLTIEVRGPSLPLRAALIRYPNARIIGLPPSHYVDGEWAYEVDFDDRILGLGFDQADPQYLRSISLRSPMPITLPLPVPDPGTRCDRPDIGR